MHRSASRARGAQAAEPAYRFIKYLIVPAIFQLQRYPGFSLQDGNVVASVVAFPSEKLRRDAVTHALFVPPINTRVCKSHERDVCVNNDDRELTDLTPGRAIANCLFKRVGD